MSISALTSLAGLGSLTGGKAHGSLATRITAGSMPPISWIVYVFNLRFHIRLTVALEIPTSSAVAF